MRKLLLTLIAVGAASRIVPAAAHPAIDVAVTGPGVQTVQYWDPGWREREDWRRHEEWRRRREWRRQEEWRAWHAYPPPPPPVVYAPPPPPPPPGYLLPRY